MKFQSIRLVNYIGIYNGMNLNEIFIDFTKCQYNTIIIRGLNGSGKSTLYNALTVLPDSNDQFIPGYPALKEITLLDNGILYDIKCTHGIKNNGERETTKVYFYKSIDGGINFIDLNPSGNVSSYKEILYEELQLDANFIALSQLSSDNRGLAIKKPAERKRFVNSIISSLECYNAIYKKLNKKSSNFKVLIDSIVSKLGQLGDIENIKSNLEEFTNRENILTSNRDQLIEQLGILKSQLNNIDPGNTIQQSYQDSKKILKNAQLELNNINNSINNKLKENSIDFIIDIDKELLELEKSISSTEIDNQILKGNLSSALADSEAEVNQLMIKQQKLESYEYADKYQSLADELASLTTENQNILNEFNSIGINDISNFSKDEFIMSINTINNIAEQISIFKSAYDYKVLEETCNIFNNKLQLPDIQYYENKLLLIENNISSTKENIQYIKSKLSIMKSLSIRPKSCIDNTCPFIKDALLLEQEGFNIEMKNNEEQKLTSLEEDKKKMIDQIEHYKKILECYNSLRNLTRNVENSTSILRKLPNIDSFIDISKLVYNILNNSNDIFNYIKTIESYSYLSNNIEIFNNNQKIINSLQSDYKVALMQAEVVDALMEDIENTRIKIKGLEDRVISIKDKIKENDLLLINLNNHKSVLSTIKYYNGQKNDIINKISEINNNISSMENAMQSIQINISNIDSITHQLNNINNELRNIINNKSKYSKALEQIEEYTLELETLKKDYDYIETIKYYSSSTTGIQLVFMEMYMGKILSLANELLSLLFNGKFVLQQFIINESEFRIPCLGSGLLNDDISSMSSAEISMISMIISFSLLYHSTTKFNIIKLDEIDAALDSNNRIMFINVLNKIMEIMNVEQCIMISHNSELQTLYSDVILLKVSEEMRNEYNSGNIIWRYN